ncbi:MAG: hypothetical protein FJ386_02820 [Verrucomicrobia bacterium]|nr:hypothetical protein [Verrucomicrobiota bacterium]
MNPPAFTARRATIDDIPPLRALWRAEQLPETDLEKRVTEFQAAFDGTGKLVGSIGLSVNGTQGCLHSETFLDFGQADELRPMLWERVHTVARNRGLTRLWTLEKTQFWRGVGFDAPDDEGRKRFSAAFGAADLPWSTLKLKDELVATMTPGQEMALFRAASKEENDKILRQARVMKWVAAVLGLLFFLFVAYGSFSWWKVQHRGGAKSGGKMLPGSRW